MKDRIEMRVYRSDGTSVAVVADNDSGHVRDYADLFAAFLFAAGFVPDTINEVLRGDDE